ncbi:MAG: transglycosylase SLT domain-containing protein [Gemmatimonadota bacterium]|nr:MAG: transglycosylase SLT domain-containing protein [Gemmatimonadota bacterium]
MKALLLAAILQGTPDPAGLPTTEPEPTSRGAVVEAATRLLDAALPLAAGDLLSRYLSLREAAEDGADPELVLLAARSYADGRAWTAARRLLGGQPWLESDGGRGLHQLARIYRGLDSLEAAAGAYRRVLEIRGAAQAASDPDAAAEVRASYAAVLSALGDHGAAARQYESAAQAAPELARWFRLSALQELSRAGQGDGARTLAQTLNRDALVPTDSVRRELAIAAFASGDWEDGVRLARALPARASTDLLAEWVAPALLQGGDTAGAVRTLRTVLERRGDWDAGELFLRLSPGWESLRLVSESERRAGRPGRAAELLREALTEAPRSEAAAIRLELAEAQFAARDDQNVVWTLARWLEGTPIDEPRIDEAAVWLLAGRAFSRLGAREAAEDAFRRSTEAGLGGPSAFAAYLLADHLQDDGRVDDAKASYQRAIARFPRSAWAARALVRLGMLSFLEGDFAGARSRFDEYRRRYPSGDWYHAMVYWTARSLEAAGDSSRAGALYREAAGHALLSYYGILASRRLGIDPYAAAIRGRGPPLEELDADWRQLLERMERLRALGWPGRAERELDAGLRTKRLAVGQQLPLALALNEAGWTRRGIRLGLAAHRREGRQWSELTLRAVYPLPYRAAIAELSRLRELDPGLVAGLIRRESLFEADVVSSAGAVGLMQLLPRTALEMSRDAGLEDLSVAQLEVPEANLRLGTLYLRRMLQRFDSYLAAALISYNAGPHRYLRWREFPERSVDPELFVERIPFRETRIYAKEVTANAFVYDRLYDMGPSRVDGPERAP